MTKEIKLLVTLQELLTIQEGLLELKAKKSIKVINKLSAQANAQIEAQDEKKEL